MRKISLLVFLIHALFIVKGGHDTIYVHHINQFNDLKEKSVKILFVDISLPSGFNYCLLPDDLLHLRFMRPCKTPKHVGCFLDKIKKVKSLEINGSKVSELVPEIILIATDLEVLKISNSKLSQIWSLSDLLYDKNLSELHFKNLTIKENCKMYERLFFGGNLTADTLFFEFNKRVNANKIIRVKYIFKAKGCYINGTLYEPYSNSQLFDKKNRLRL